jgi:2-(1,2-epoxy-1,2-dihydrophenyl)acetyl-CoA isomerase
MSENAVLYAVADRVATITLNRPEARNPLSQDVSAELVRLLRLADTDPGVKCILIQAVGENFSAGGDVKGFSETLALSPEERYDQFERRLLVAGRLPNALLENSKPIVVATRGAVAGAGMALCLAADFVIAADNTFFLAAHVHVGLSVDCGLSGLLIGAMGVKAAKRFTLLGEKVGASDALSLGIVTTVVADEALEDEAAKLIRRLAKGPAAAMAGTKMLLNHAAFRDFGTVINEEAYAIARCVAKDDFRKGVEGMLNKKPATFD